MKSDHFVEDKQYKIIDHDTKQELFIHPKAIESCMVPGTFRIIPIHIYEKDEKLVYEVEDMRIEVSLQEIKDGSKKVIEETFVPTVIRKKDGCNPCTNCGRCSW